MNDKEYIMIGAPIITREIFRNVLRPLNNYSFKPSGGFWTSEHKSNIYDISDWFKHLKHDATSIARYKNLNQSTIFTLKENAKIITVDTPEKVLELAKKYPSYHHSLGYFGNITERETIFDYEALTKDYDGIYINYNVFTNQLKTIVLDTIGVNSLLLFNLDCIKEYQTTPITFDIDKPYSIPYINEDTIGKPQKIEEESYEHKILSKLTENIYQDLMNKYSNYSFEDYDKYMAIITQNVKKLIEILKENEIKKATKITEYLKSKGMNSNIELILQNIVLDYLSKYLIQNEEQIKTIPKSKVKTPKSYSII